MTRGVGFRIVPGAFSYIEESGGSAGHERLPFNHSIDPFNPDGTRVQGENDVIRHNMIGRYKGGNEDFWNWVPNGDYGEIGVWRPNAVLEAMYDAWKSGRVVNLPEVFVFEGNPNDYDGLPTNREITDYQYAVNNEWSDRLYTMYLPFMRRMDGNTPPRPPRREPNTVPTVPSVVPPVTPTADTPVSSTGQDTETKKALAKLLLIQAEIGVLSDRLAVQFDELLRTDEKNPGRLVKMEKQLRTLLTRSNKR